MHRLLVVLLVPVAGCGAARVNQFQRFAEAGSVWAEAVEAVTAEAAGVSVDADSAVLARARPRLPEEDRARTVLDHDELLRQRIEILADLRRHARLLRAYFTALGALAAADAPREIGAAAGRLADSMTALSERLEQARLGDETIGSFSGRVVTLSVAGFRQAALEHELRTRSRVIERELDLQEAAMKAIAAAMRADLQASLSWQEQSEVVDPYAASGSRLAKSWTRRRREILTATPAVDSADAAARAAASLKSSFAALVENRLTPPDVETLLADVDEVVALLGLLRALDEEE